MLANLQAQSIRTLLQPFEIDAPDIKITDLVLDSRDVAIHKGFAAIKGHALDGRDFIPQAISLGAKVIFSETDDQSEHGNMDMREQSLIIQFFALSDRLSELAVAFYKAPADDMQVVAVTGTNGKTSTVQLCTQLRHHLGDSSASIGTLGTGIYTTDTARELTETRNTTPDAIEMQRLLACYRNAGVEQIALEASSHALVQGRMRALKTDIAVFTNLTRDHLDYHGTMAEYARAKRLLLQQPGLSAVVLNAEDPEHQAWRDNAPDGVEIVLFSTQALAASDEVKFCYAREVEYVPQGLRIELCSSWGDCQLQVPLIGRFNVQNLLAAVSVQLLQGGSLQAISDAASQVKPVAGRMEIFSHGLGAPMIVDYAHTPDALEQALLAARNHCSGELWCVFGCGGDRDQGKRSLMGEVAEKFSDRIILTNDNSRSESPQKIVEDILSGCARPDAITIELDRETAIASAFDQAAQGDLILIAGKGHEDYQIIGEQQLPYNEREYVKRLSEGNEP